MTTDTARQYNRDGEVCNARDAQQVVQTYRAAYSRRRARWLVEGALRHGHPEECNAVFQDALDNLDW